MAELSERERITLLMMRGWGDRQRSYAQVRQIFNTTYRVNEIPISRATVQKTIQRFQTTGSVKNRPISGRPVTVSTAEKKLEVALSFVENPNLTIRKAAHTCEMDKKLIHNVLKEIKFHPYKIHFAQELIDGDADRRSQFCEEMMQMIIDRPDFHFHIIFSDEATFTLHGEVNRHNCRYWSDSNPHWMSSIKTQWPQKLNVWAGLLGDQVIGPYFIEGNLNAVKYEDLLRNQILPAIMAITGDGIEDYWFQQDGAAAHYGLNVREYLDNMFPHRWIGRRGHMEWPPRSPDLTTLDYFLWGYLKGKVYATQPADLQELRRRIEDQCAIIPPEMIRRAVGNFYYRLAYCQEANGEQFEHKL